MEEFDLDGNKYVSSQIVKPYDNKSRRRAYRKIIAGIRYHKGEKLSFVTIGFRRGTVVDVRKTLMKLTTFIKRITGKRIEYSRVKVLDNKSPDGLWRIHSHMIWNAPYVKQALLVEKIKGYIGDSCSVDIRLLDDNDRKATRYLMQYLGNQDGMVRFDFSRNWLPKGYERVWKEIRDDFYEHVKLGIRTPLQSDSDYVILASQQSYEWKKEAMIENMNLWLDEQRLKRDSHAEDRQSNIGEKVKT
jgi:hypothetical protein